MPESKTSPLKLVVLISGSGSNLQAFIDQISAGELDAEICAVISNKADAFGLERAEKAGIPSIAISHKDFDSREAFDQSLIKEIQNYSPDLVILAGFMRILTADFINAFSDQILNIHPSLLPIVTAELDDGPVLIQGKLNILASDTPDSIQQRIHKIEHQIYPLTVQWIANQKIPFTSGKINKSECNTVVLSYDV